MSAFRSDAWAVEVQNRLLSLLIRKGIITEAEKTMIHVEAADALKASPGDATAPNAVDNGGDEG